MSYHIVDVSSEGVVLSVKNRQLVCRDKDGAEKSLPLEDVASVVVNSFSALFHSSFLAAAAEEKIAVIVCKDFKPRSVVLPVQRGADTLLTRAQIGASGRLMDTIWRKTVDAKVANQYSLLEFIRNEDHRLGDFRVAMGREDVSKEGNCARIYWDIYATALFLRGFHRLMDGDGLNGLLNYAYGVLVSRVLQRLLAFGLDPMYGVGHAVRERAMPLAYDVMEPFRPAFDWEVFKWAQACMKREEPLLVDRAFKTMAQGIFQKRHPYQQAKAVTLEAILDQVVKSLREAYLTGKTTAYKPWIRKSSKWDG